MKKQRIHNEWFRPVSLGGRKSCPSCKAKKAGQLYSWGEYICAKWHTVDYFCQHCFADRIARRLIAHADPCGCKIALIMRGAASKPDWLTLDSPTIEHVE